MRPIACSKPSILVVDDQAHIRRLLQHVLEKEHFQVVLANGGEEAILRLSSSSFNAVILDLQMPIVSGLDVLRFIRGRPELKNLVVIVVSARSLNKDEISATGASAHCAKPIAPSTLLSKLEEFGVFARGDAA